MPEGGGSSSSRDTSRPLYGAGVDRTLYPHKGPFARTCHPPTQTGVAFLQPRSTPSRPLSSYSLCSPPYPDHTPTPTRDLRGRGPDVCHQKTLPPDVPAPTQFPLVPLVPGLLRPRDGSRPARLPLWSVRRVRGPPVPLRSPVPSTPPRSSVPETSPAEDTTGSPTDGYPVESRGRGCWKTGERPTPREASVDILQGLVGGTSYAPPPQSVRPVDQSSRLTYEGRRTVPSGRTPVLTDLTHHGPSPVLQPTGPK